MTHKDFHFDSNLFSLRLKFKYLLRHWVFSIQNWSICTRFSCRIFYKISRCRLERESCVNSFAKMDFIWIFSCRSKACEHLTISENSIAISNVVTLLTMKLRIWLILRWQQDHYYSDVIMGAMASQITSVTLVYSTFYSAAYERKHQSSASLAFVRVIHRWPVNFPHKWPVTRKMLVVNKMSFALPWQPPTDNITCIMFS